MGGSVEPSLRSLIQLFEALSLAYARPATPSLLGVRRSVGYIGPVCPCGFAWAFCCGGGHDGSPDVVAPGRAPVPRAGTGFLLMSLREPAVWQTPDVVAAGR
jgi:hypothetical protein